VRAAEQERPDVAEARRQWKNDQTKLDPTKLVFVDETGASTQMARLYGRAKRGRRVVSAIPWGHWKTVTFVAGLRLIRKLSKLVTVQGPSDRPEAGAGSPRYKAR
jgi:hypothetical protein